MMGKVIIYSSLLHIIEKFYIKISLVILHRRINTHQESSQLSGSLYDNDIKPSLVECIDEIINHDEPSSHHKIDYSLVPNLITAPHPTLHYSTLKSHTVNKKNVGELSKYFKARSNGSDVHPNIQETLEHSTWEHLHSAVRYARQNDNRNAKMHTNIACTACKELEHYIPEEQYKAFVIEIEKHLDTLKSSDENNEKAQH